VAEKLELDAEDVKKAISERRHAKTIERDADLADDLVALGTPYFFVNGRRIPATLSLDRLKNAIEQELASTKTLLAKPGVTRANAYEHITSTGRGPLPLETRKLDWYSTRFPGTGSDGVRVMLIEFCDYTHFMCRLVEPTIQELLSQFKGDLGFVWADVPADGEVPRLAAVAGRVAWTEKGVDGFDQMRHLLLEGQKPGLSEAKIKGFGVKIGFKPDEFARALENPALVSEIERGKAEAVRAKIEVPGFLVCDQNLCTTGGYYLGGGHPKRAFEKRVRLVLESGGK